MISTVLMFGRARNHGKKFLKYTQTSFSSIVNLGKCSIQVSSGVSGILKKDIWVVFRKFSLDIHIVVSFVGLLKKWKPLLKVVKSYGKTRIKQ